MRSLALLAAGLLVVVPHTHPARAQLAADTVDGRTFFLPLITREASLRGLPPEIADAVAMVETGYRPDAVGSSGEIGLMQVMPATAAGLGFRGTPAELADPETNIRLGVAYLARAWSVGEGDICRALTKYRAGLGQESVTPLSAQYCARAVAWLADAGNRLPDTLAAQQNVASTVPDPHVTAMLPALPEQAGLSPTLGVVTQTISQFPRRQIPANLSGLASDRRREKRAAEAR